MDAPDREHLRLASCTSACLFFYDDEDRLVSATGPGYSDTFSYNSLRPHPAYLSYLCHHFRKRIETTFSTMTEWLGRRLHAVTPEGYERKVFLTVLAYAILP